ncbi:MFS transporter [Syntrophobacter fumaroxidans]|uniref:Major facilitator superfamily MFS_1 n=1 Tax=Syntrophobacter fumaroxidans (strain DSM 10017 / MPOB) TaxID=335543 RepID=A0LNW9_SYNFM|nr:MFS transporter [Syntrophobacter fumaroxidans]ABK19121.1 major facilitator superfamily MFS_1 [Syntrophobacter fumaroxidans MPOB]
MKSDRKIVSWALYDWANSAFATTVMAGFFPVFFKEYWSAGTDASVSTFHLGAANSLSSVIVAALTPILGAIADRGNSRKRFLFFFTALGIFMTGCLFHVGKGNWELAAAIYVVASIGFFCGCMFYDSLIVNVADDPRLDYVSALGYAYGYLGGGLLFALNVAMTLSPGTFGLAGPGEAVRLSFVSVAVWWAVFSVPIFVFVKEPRHAVTPSVVQAVREGFRQLGASVARIRSFRVVILFLLGYWLYIDATSTIIRMAVDYGLSLGFSSRSLVLALLITQFVAFPCAIAFGKIGERIGAKNGIFICIGVYFLITLWGYFMENEIEFYILAVLIATVQGGIQSLSRSLFARIIPKSQSGEFFGFYNMLGKFAAVIGPVLMGWASLVTGSPRISILTVGILFLGGAAVLTFVDEAEGRRLVERLEDNEQQAPQPVLPTR